MIDILDMLDEIIRLMREPTDKKKVAQLKILEERVAYLKSQYLKLSNELRESYEAFRSLRTSENDK